MTDDLHAVTRASELDPPGTVAWPHCLNDPAGWPLYKVDALWKLLSGTEQIAEQLLGDREHDAAAFLSTAVDAIRAAHGMYDPIVPEDEGAF